MYTIICTTFKILLSEAASIYVTRSLVTFTFWHSPTSFLMQPPTDLAQSSSALGGDPADNGVSHADGTW